MILESTVLMTILRYIIPIIGGIIGFLICVWWENLGKDEKTKRVKNWLVYAVTAAEKLYGPKMGVIKLQYVYEEFTKLFPVFAKKLPYDTFKDMVDEALAVMKHLQETNSTFNEYIEEGV